MEEPVATLGERVQTVMVQTHPTARIVIATAAGLSVLGVVTTMIFSEPAVPYDSTVTAYEQAQADQRDAQVRTEVLAEIVDPQAELDDAAAVAGQIVELQRATARDTAAVAEASSMDTAEVRDVSRQMRPYFANTTDEALGPWYLAAADVDADAGVGFGTGGFDFTVTWRVDSVSTISTNGTVPVRFSAYKTDSLDEAEPVLLAWATAEFDPQQDTMSDLVTGTTQAGQQAQLKVGA